MTYSYPETHQPELLVSHALAADVTLHLDFHGKSRADLSDPQAVYTFH